MTVPMLEVLKPRWRIKMLDCKNIEQKSDWMKNIIGLQSFLDTDFTRKVKELIEVLLFILSKC